MLKTIWSGQVISYQNLSIRERERERERDLDIDQEPGPVLLFGPTGRSGSVMFFLQNKEYKEQYVWYVDAVNLE